MRKVFWKTWFKLLHCVEDFFYFYSSDETHRLLRLRLAELSTPKFYLLFGTSKFIFLWFFCITNLRFVVGFELVPFCINHLFFWRHLQGEDSSCESFQSDLPWQVHSKRLRIRCTEHVCNGNSHRLTARDNGGRSTSYSEHVNSN